MQRVKANKAAAERKKKRAKEAVKYTQAERCLNLLIYEKAGDIDLTKSKARIMSTEVTLTKDIMDKFCPRYHLKGLEFVQNSCFFLILGRLWAKIWAKTFFFENWASSL